MLKQAISLIFRSVQPSFFKKMPNQNFQKHTFCDKLDSLIHKLAKLHPIIPRKCLAVYKFVIIKNCTKSKTNLKGIFSHWA